VGNRSCRPTRHTASDNDQWYRSSSGVNRRRKVNCSTAPAPDSDRQHEPESSRLKGPGIHPGFTSNTSTLDHRSRGDGPKEEGDDGVVAYKSAHIDEAVSEKIIRWGHSCQDQPETIEEVRRILLEHLATSDIQNP